jgi:hypothetical protein
VISPFRIDRALFFGRGEGGQALAGREPVVVGMDPAMRRYPDREADDLLDRGSVLGVGGESPMTTPISAGSCWRNACT